MPRSLTVGQLIRQLETLNPDLPVRLAVNPDWPFSHFVGRVVDADSAAFIAEDGQEGYLPRTGCAALNWATGTASGSADEAVAEPDGEPWYLYGVDAASTITELFEQPDWTIDDERLPATYTAPGSHLLVRLDNDKWVYEARKERDAEPVWRASFTTAVPAEAIRAFTAALLTAP
jgi:hypothetical protein